jgi:hypothetical protein
MTYPEMDLMHKLEKYAAELPETISLDDVRKNRWLMRIVCIADDINNRAERRALEWAKSQ